MNKPPTQPTKAELMQRAIWGLKRGIITEDEFYARAAELGFTNEQADAALLLH